MFFAQSFIEMLIIGALSLITLAVTGILILFILDLKSGKLW
jgi:hypothetical protein